MSTTAPPAATIRPPAFFLMGTGLVLVKFLLDWAVSTFVFARDWTPLNYVVAPGGLGVLDLESGDRTFFLTMLVLSLPFVAVGVWLTVLRLRDAGLPTPAVVLFFVPLVNIVFLLMLSVLPSKPRAEGEAPLTAIVLPTPEALRRFGGSGERWQDSERWLRVRTAHRRITREHTAREAVLSLGVTVPAALGFIVLSTTVLKNYGWALFVGTPFCVGLVSVLLYGLARPKPFGACLGLAMIAATLIGVVSLFIALEGAICLIMAAPLGYALVFVGAVYGYALQARPWSSPSHLDAILAAALTLPALMAGESVVAPEPPLWEVKTTVEVDAPPRVVWQRVVSFPDLPPPHQLLFRCGVAYPIRAKIEGHGAGAVRHCVFSTGAFVEPIDTWDEPNMLAFRVTEQPEPMTEWSPFDIHPPHLDGYLVSERGAFRLVALSGGRTRLEGTTWYRNRMWPTWYWRLWSDAIIHRIHRRVLEHIRTLAEADAG
jgi:hypothetical protein